MIHTRVFCRIINCSDYRDTVDILTQHFSDYQGSFGVLLFLYSVILTKVSHVLSDVLAYCLCWNVYVNELLPVLYAQ